MSRNDFLHLHNDAENQNKCYNNKNSGKNGNDRALFRYLFLKAEIFRRQFRHFHIRLLEPFPHLPRRRRRFLPARL